VASWNGSLTSHNCGSLQQSDKLVCGLEAIRTYISEHGSTVNAGFYVDKRDKLTRKVRWQQLDDDFRYAANELDRSVVAKDQIRTIIQTFRDRLFTEIFPGRTEVPKTLIFAKDDSHADDIVQIVREEFGKGNDFAQKITYRTGTARHVAENGDVTWINTGAKPEHLLSSFRNSYNPRIAVTVDMIATGTDIKPLEIVFFMRSVRSRNFFEQMKGRGTRVIESDDLRAVTPDARFKTHFIIVDAVGLWEGDMSTIQAQTRGLHGLTCTAASTNNLVSPPSRCPQGYGSLLRGTDHSRVQH
jgi:type I restriction enzyme R subunit